MIGLRARAVKTADMCQEEMNQRLDEISARLALQRTAATNEAQQTWLVYNTTMKILEHSKIQASDPVSVLKYAADRASRHQNHACSMSLCRMENLPAGRYVHPVTGTSFDSDGTYYICDAVRIGKDIIPGSLKIHRCAMYCTQIAMDCDPLARTRDDVAHCPITGMAKASRQLNVPSYGEMKISAKNVIEMAEIDRRDYMGVSRAKKDRKAWSSRRRQRVANLQPEVIERYKSILSLVLDTLTSPENHKISHSRCLASAHRKALDAEIRSPLRLKEEVGSFELICRYWKTLNDLCPEDAPRTPAPLSAEKRDIIFKRVGRVWDCVIASHEKRQQGSSRKRRATPTFEGITTATLICLSSEGIHSQHRQPYGSGSLCFLPQDPDLRNASVSFECFKYILAKTGIRGLDAPKADYLQNLNIIRGAAQSLVDELKIDCDKKLESGFSLEEATEVYAEKCEEIAIK